MPERDKRNSTKASKIRNLGKPLLILSAVTALSMSLPGIPMALADTGQQTTGTSTATGNAVTGSTSTTPAAQPASSSVTSGKSAATPPAAASSSSAPAPASSATAPSAASSAPASTTATGKTANAQNNVAPTQPNKVTNSVGSTAKTVSPATVAGANIKTVQAPQANFTAVKTMAASSATSDVTTRFIGQISSEAQQIASANNLYASVMIAQAILESASGQSGLTLQADNLFGIKGTYNGQYVTMQTSEYKNGQWVEVDAEFRKYPSLSASLQDYANLLKNGLTYNPNFYAQVWKSNAPTYTAAAQALQGTYATDPSYASKLDNLITEYDLTRFDSNPSASVVSSSGSTGTATSGSTTASTTKPTATTSTPAAGTVGSTVKTKGILYVSSDAAAPVKTYLSTVKISRIYTSAVNKYQVTNNGVIVGYLRTISGSTTTSTTKPTATTSTPAAGTVGSTVKTNGILYVSSDAAAPVKTYLSTVKISRIYTSAVNKYQVTNNGVIVGYLRTY